MESTYQFLGGLVLGVVFLTLTITVMVALSIFWIKLNKPKK